VARNDTGWVSKNNQKIEKMANSKKTIGEEVVEWAEKYWHIDKLQLVVEGEAEKFSYEYFRKVFIQKIETEIRDRLFPENFTQEIGSLEGSERGNTEGNKLG
jgi:hypothetical protein